MDPVMSDVQLAAVEAVVRDRLGLHFPRERLRELEAALHLVAGPLGCDGVDAAARRIIGEPLDPTDLRTLAQALTVGETNFCRDTQVFSSLERDILPDLIDRRRASDRRIRIWSAGCCTGEEPYTVAMILRRLLPDIDDWNVTLLATDINTDFLGRAQEGVYGKWSFRRTPGWMVRRHFTRRGDGKLAIDSAIRRMVTFEELNLADAVYPSVYNQTNAMDVVLCRNVLIYFDQTTVERVIRRLRASLLPDGWLTLGRSERVPSEISELCPARIRGEFWYRRRDDPAREERRVLGPVASRPVRATPFRGALQQLFDGGDYSVAARDLTAYLKDANPSRTDRHRAMRLLAQACANLGRLDEAQTWCEEALAQDNLDARLHYLHASILLERSLADEAETSLRRSLAADDRFVLAHFALGNLMRRRGLSDRARQHFERTLALLRHHQPDEILPDSEGLSAGRLSEVARRALSLC
jgi:chemotaxis protein methyltransferase CheR